MTFTSNVNTVIEHLGSFVNGLPEAVDSAFDTKLWLPRAEEEAEKVLKIKATEEQQALVPAFVETVRVNKLGPGAMEWSMENVRASAQRESKEAIRTALLSNMSLDQAAEFIKELNYTEDVIQKWVTQAKDITESDREDPEDIARGIRWILFGEWTDAWREAAMALLKGRTHSHGPSIMEFAERESDILDPETVATWLAAVGKAWRELLLEELPEQIVAAIKKLKEKSFRA